MKISILDKEYVLTTGLSFIAELDEKYQHRFGNVEFGFGVGKVFLLLSQYNPIAIANFILAGTNTLEDRPSIRELEKEMNTWSEVKVVEVADSFLELLATNSLTKPQVGQIGAMIEVMGNLEGYQQNLQSEPTND